MSVPFQVGDCVRWTKGELVQGPDDTRLSGVAIDSRRVTAGQLFVAILGPNHDAHRFIPQALEQKAAALLLRAAEPRQGLKQMIENSPASARKPAQRTRLHR